MKWEIESDKQWLLEISHTGAGLGATHAKSLTTESESSHTVDDEKAPLANAEKVPDEVQSHGEGIGLLIVRHLCQLLDAIINVKTKPGAGTTFNIIFPLELSEH